MKPFSTWLHAAREGRKWTLEQTARATGLSKTHVYALEKGVTLPTLDVAEHVAKSFGAKLSDVVLWLEESD